MRGLFCLFLGLWISVNSTPIQVPANLSASDCRDLYQNHPGDYPFVSDASFMVHCNHRVNCVSTVIDPAKVLLGDTIFVADWYIKWFLDKVHPEIKHPYILISGDTAGDHPTWQERVILYDPKIAAWFSKNMLISNHPKCRIYSLGPSIAQWAWHSPISDSPISYFDYFCELMQKTIPKIEYPLAYLRMGENGRLVRKEIIKYFADKDFCFHSPEFLDRCLFWEELAKMEFVFTPSGFGYDTVRAWEAIALNTIPIVQHSPIDAVYEGTPTIFVHSWTEVTPEFLREQKEIIQKGLQDGKLSKDKVFFKYWADEIYSIKQSLKKGTWNKSDPELTKLNSAQIETLRTILFKDLGNFNHMIIHGNGLHLRLFQFANEFGSKFSSIFTTDEYAFEHRKKDVHFKELSKFNGDQSLFTDLKLGDKIVYITPSALPARVKYEKDWKFRVFMDLTYFRYNFTKQLAEFCRYMPEGTIICGNLAEDRYVQELLAQFSAQNPFLFIDTTNGIWHLTLPTGGG